MIKLDKNTISFFEEKGSEKIKIFFYGAGCSGNKIDISDDFEITDDLISLPFTKGVPEGGGIRNIEGIKIYIEKKDKEKLENCSITRVVKADHTGKEKIRYIFSSEKIQDRCGCGTSFAFEKKIPKINLSKLKSLKNGFLNK